MTTTFEIDRKSGLRHRLGQVIPYALLILSILPIVVGYAWIFIATFSFRTEGLLPKDAAGNIGGWTLQNWMFLADPEIWRATLNSFGIAMGMVIGVGSVSALTGYALSRMNFAGRKGFLGMTLILHAFRPELLLIAIFFVLRFIATLPGIGPFFGNIPWDMERAALIDGASRFRVWWEIILPQIRPGIAALAIFTFITGWNAYLIPFTFTLGSKVSNLPVYLNRLQADVAPVGWNQIAAVGLFQLVPVMIFFIFTQEMLLNIYSGGAKGGT
jgi:inositol-phosphate transport system permease protein